MHNKLYVISPESVDLDLFKDQLDAVLSTGCVKLFQLRLKKIDLNQYIKAARLLKGVCDLHNVTFLVNDSIEVARAVGADGIHVGKDDSSDIVAIRESLGKDAIIGVSCYQSIDRAMIAGEAGADYVSFGAVYPTQTKEVSGYVGLETLSWWSEYTNIPLVAIGGITPSNVVEILKTGVDYVAVISSIWNHSINPVDAVVEFQERIDSLFAKQLDSC